MTLCYQMHGRRLATFRYCCSYGEKTESHNKEVVEISTYEEFTIILGVAMLIVGILNYVKK